MLLATKAGEYRTKIGEMVFLRWRKCLTDPKQVLRLTAVVAILCIAFYQLSECFRKIIQPPISTHYSFRLNETLSYPALTICRSPPYKPGVFEKYGMTSLNPKFHGSWRHFKFDNHTVEQFFEEATFSFNEILPFYGFDGFNTNVAVRSFYLLDYGRCFTLTPINETTRWNSDGYFFYFKHTETVKKVSQYGVSTSGFNIHIHDRREVYTGIEDNSYCLLDQVYIETAEEMRVNLKLQVFEQLPTNTNRCNRGRAYSKSECQRQCLTRRITEMVGCDAPWLPNDNLPSCRTYNETFNLIREYTTNYYSHVASCSCERSCNLKVYTPYIRSRKDLILPDSKFYISFSSNLVTIMEEIMGYDWNMFLADLGGSLGFLLGLSVLGAIGALEQMLKVMISKKNEKENAKVENNANETSQKIGNKEIEIYFKDRKLIDDAIQQHRKDNRADAKIYDGQMEKGNNIQRKY